MFGEVNIPELNVVNAVLDVVVRKLELFNSKSMSLKWLSFSLLTYYFVFVTSHGGPLWLFLQSYFGYIIQEASLLTCYCLSYYYRDRD